MVRKRLKTETGMSMLETVAILAIVSIGAIAAANFLKQSNGNFFGTLGMDNKIVEVVTKAKDEAELVVVGKIVGMSKQIQQNADRGDSVLFIQALWTLEIESVERGHYPGNTISFFVGWMSNRVIPQEFPAGIKKSYKNGDRVKVFLAYGPPGKGNNEPSYFTRFSYLCLEPQ